MNLNAIMQIFFYFLTVIVLVKPVGWYMAKVYEGKMQIPGLKRVETLFYRVCGIQPTQEMNWKTYLTALLLFNLCGVLVVYFIQRLQGILPLNPQHFAAVSPNLAFNTAVSFATNTNWQAYSGETTLSYFTQMIGLTVQNFCSAATGMAVLIAFIRGLVRQETSNLGNFWVDMIRSIFYILLPLAFLFSILLVSQGTIQNFKPYQKTVLIQPVKFEGPRFDEYNESILDSHGQPVTELKTLTEQVLPMGPAASQIAIKQLGTNGGGFFNTNSAHPYENPTLLSNFFEMLAILLLPAAFCYTFGLMVGDRRQGWAILLTMALIIAPLTCITTHIEQRGNPLLAPFGVDLRPQQNGSYAGGNMEGKETRFGIVDSAIWATATTSASNGSVNSMHDSFMPLGGLIPLLSMQLGEVVFGGAGSGLVGMLIFVILAVFISGLMVGRTPEFLGKKIEPYEMKMASFIILVMPMMVLFMTSLAVCTPEALSSRANLGPHGFSEILYAFSSLANNNGSAFAGLNANTSFYNILGGIAMLIGRYWIFIPALAIAGSLARKKTIPSSVGTLPTNTFLFVLLLMGVILIVGALTFFPALALGPVVEHLML